MVEATRDSVNRLKTAFGRAEGTRKAWFIISQYATMLLLGKANDEFVNQATNVAVGVNNLALHGWIFELRFMILVKKGTVTLVDRVTNKEETWPAPKYFPFDNASVISTNEMVCFLLKCLKTVWLI